mmetsp:Transcript_62219/g.196410  ORF Transcript_62219/g.196410 Transcript_62219/m.196410 type:complete len:387 (-) Transcript_62219:88-1248(-)
MRTNQVSLPPGLRRHTLTDASTAALSSRPHCVQKGGANAVLRRLAHPAARPRPSASPWACGSRAPGYGRQKAGRASESSRRCAESQGWQNQTFRTKRGSAPPWDTLWMNVSSNTMARPASHLTSWPPTDMRMSPRSGTISPRCADIRGALPKCGFRRAPGRKRRKPAPTPGRAHSVTSGRDRSRRHDAGARRQWGSLHSRPRTRWTACQSSSRGANRASAFWLWRCESQSVPSSRVPRRSARNSPKWASRNAPRGRTSLGHRGPYRTCGKKSWLKLVSCGVRRGAPNASYLLKKGRDLTWRRYPDASRMTPAARATSRRLTAACLPTSAATNRRWRQRTWHCLWRNCCRESTAESQPLWIMLRWSMPAASRPAATLTPAPCGPSHQ